MEASLYGRIDAPVVAAVGVWEPFLPEHRQLIDDLTRHARQAGRASLAVMLDPAPASMALGPTPWPECNDTATRLRLLEHCGIDGVLLIRFAEADLSGSAADLFALLFVHARLAELWLGAGQSFGRGPDGTPQAIAQLAADYGVELRELPPSSVALSGRKIRRLLAKGCLADVARMVDRPPVHSRPVEGRARFAWLPGVYQAAPLPEPAAPVGPATLELELVDGRDGYAYLDWPDEQIAYLAFVAGPGDALVPAERMAMNPSVPAERARP